MSKSRFLINKYCPNIYTLLQKRKYKKWEDLDVLITNQILTKKDIKTNLIRLLFEIEKNDTSFLKSFATHIDVLIQELISTLPHKEKRLWNSFNGKFDNIEDWNYLNPIGEFSVLKKLLDSNTFELIEIEAIFPNGKNKDFLFKQKNDTSMKYIEVINIHLPTDMANFTDIKRHLISKVNHKIENEIKGIVETKCLDNLFIAPVVWFLDTKTLKENYSFFKEFTLSLGKAENILQNTLGFCTYVKTSDNQFIFGEASSIIDKYEV